MKLIINDTEYDIDAKITNLLEAFTYIKEVQNKSFGFNYGCRSGICGNCSVRVNGVETLACIKTIEDNDIIQPLSNLPVLKDLVVDTKNIREKLQLAKSFLISKSDEIISENRHT
jgi:succinate dehydrogenase/fumarate reductase iron-sulfur protein